jgi:hypothetical protein
MLLQHDVALEAAEGVLADDRHLAVVRLVGGGQHALEDVVVVQVRLVLQHLRQRHLQRPFVVQHALPATGYPTALRPTRPARKCAPPR